MLAAAAAVVPLGFVLWFVELLMTKKPLPTRKLLLVSV